MQLHTFCSGNVCKRVGRLCQDYKIDEKQKKGLNLRLSPWVHQAGVLHAISPISVKLGQFKGSTPKLKMTNWFVVWIFMVGDSSPN